MKRVLCVRRRRRVASAVDGEMHKREIRLFISPRTRENEARRPPYIYFTLYMFYHSDRESAESIITAEQIRV